ncbi:putative protease YhbU precursor [Poriferisphaera corsica]|uniref:Putative protease YhbU n=1 Tax=Poriferisphaera corsica TaxID=2528020 RepID=A0A517YPT7_9BACT|nr:peptidase U32 family protein [Poriferisphaera corsica]QDU32231.1 putative protease YhbU precursor [Poriferisphaera corsica]
MDTSHVELLAPAGCFPSLQAAINAGADAIYFGLGNLNMRSVARRSFDTTDLPEIMARVKAAPAVHSGKPIKAYLALNTVVYDNELDKAREILTQAKANNVDAVILADMAILQIAKDLDLPVHLSTQLSISNYQALSFYAPHCERVVLARECSLSKIRVIHEQIQSNHLLGNTGHLMELEAFAHGALCIATSGRCSMSLYHEGLSANRGACRQLCRRSYKVTDTDTGQEMTLDNNFVFSPSDIAVIDILDQVIASGISVLKVEGRGRAPEYVHTVITAYRKALTALRNNTYNKDFVESLFTDLKTVYNRDLSTGYYLGKPQEWSKKYGSKATHTKTIVGPVTNFFTKLNVAEIHAQAAPISVGDKFAIIGPTTGVLEGIITELRVDEQSVQTAPQGSRFSLKLPNRVRRSDSFYYMKPAAN